jgi:hypothetical protein
MTLRKGKILGFKKGNPLEFERGSTGSQCLENMF